MSETDDFETQAIALARAGRLAGYAAGIHQRGLELGLIATAIEQEHEEGDDLMSVAQVLADAAAAVQTSAGNVKTAIDDAIARLSDNPTAADIQGVVDSLTATSAELDAAATAAGTIDPNAPGGVVTDPAGGGGVVEAPPA